MPKWLREGLEAFDELFGIDLIVLWEGLSGEDEDQKPIWMVSTDDAARNKLKRWEAELLAKQLRQDHELVLLGKDDGDGKMTIVKTYRKDASTMKIPIHHQYDKTKPPIGWLEVDEKFQGEVLGGCVIAPGGRSEDGKIVEVLEFGLIPSETFDTRHDSVPIRGLGNAVVGYVRLSESMTFTQGWVGDLSLVPVTEGGGDAERLTGYRIVGPASPVRLEAGTKVNIDPGPYIFHVGDDGAVAGLEAIPAKHILEVREDGYSLQHPYECRAGGKSLHDCEMWKRVQAMKDELEDLVQRSQPARYFCTWNAEAERLELENADGSSVEASIETEERPEPQLPPVDLSGALWGVKMNPGTSAPGEIRPAESREIAEKACLGVGVLVHRATVDDEWTEVAPDGE